MKQLRTIKFNLQKETFINLFLMLTVVLLFMPFVSTFNDILTRIVINLRAYSFIREVVVPFEVRLVAVVLLFLGYDVAVTQEYVILGTTEPFLAEIVWNCIGWQSLLFFLISAFIGLQGDKFSLLSKLKALAIGVLGTFLVNIGRIVAVTLAAYYFGQNVALFIHDYGSLLISITWLFAFWWFVYTFVLEERTALQS